MRQSSIAPSVATELAAGGVVNADAWDPGVARMLIDVGFLGHLRARLPDYQQIDPRPPEQRMLPMLTGNQNEPEQIVRLERNSSRS